MPIRTILVPSWPGFSLGRRLDPALSIARRVGAHLEVLFVEPEAKLLATALSGYGEAAGYLDERSGQDPGQHARRDAQSEFESWRKRSAVPCEMENGLVRSHFARWSERIGRPERVVVQKGRLSDLIVLDCPKPGESELDDVFFAALFQTGRPVIVLPPSEPIPTDLLRHVAIAWNGSLEATRALAGSLPLLHEADHVTVLSTPGLVDHAFADNSFPEDLDLVEALSWHGVQAQQCKLNANAGMAAEALLQTAHDKKVTLLVMGAFNRGPLPDSTPSGVTRHILRQPSLPLLMAH